MKNIILAIALITLSSCQNREDKTCNCTEQRFERNATYNISDQSMVSSTNWVAVGTSQQSSVNDCSRNGSVGKSGVAETYGGGTGPTYVKKEYEYRLTCK